MHLLPSVGRTLPAISLCILVASSGCKTPISPSTGSPPASTQLSPHSDTSIEDLDKSIIAAGQDRAKQAVLATRWIGILRNDQTGMPVRQAICERLSLFTEDALLSGENRAFFLGMLAKPEELNLGRLALDRVPGESVDRLYLEALQRAESSTQLGLIQSVGNRRIADAVAALTPLVRSSDSAKSQAAIKALAQIGTKAALSALRAAPEPFSAPVVEARIAAAHRIGGSDASQEFTVIAASENAPAHLRAAAFRGAAFADLANGPSQLLTAIAGNNLALKPVAIEAISSHPSKELGARIAEQLATFDPATQAAVIPALAMRDDVKVVGAISTAARHTDPSVRAAAVSALGRLPGNADVALLLARIAADDTTDVSKKARQSLARLTGPGVAEAIISGASQGDGPLRVVLLEQIAARNMSGSIPLLLKTREDPVPAARIAALSSLADIAPASEQAALLSWAIAATDANEQSRALRTLASVTLRNPDVTQRAQPIIDAIEKSEPTIALRLLPVLPRIGGEPSAESAARLALRDDPAISSAAITTLSRWTDKAGLLPLVDVAAKTTSETTRTRAMQAVASYLERTRDVSSSQLTSIVARLVPLCQEQAVKQRLVYLLGRSAEEDALSLAKKFEAQPELSSVAADATAIIVSKRSGKISARASANDVRIMSIMDGKASTRWVVPARPDQWIEVDFKGSRPFRQIVLDNAGADWGAPVEFAVFVSDDTSKLGEPIVTGAGQPSQTTIDLPANTRGRYLTIRHTGNADDGVWAIGELVVD
jgi:hypothetical protein